MAYNSRTAYLRLNQTYLGTYNSSITIKRQVRGGTEVLLPSGTVTVLPAGTVSLLKITTTRKKAPIVRGIAKNPVDHPNGGNSNIKKPFRTP